MLLVDPGQIMYREMNSPESRLLTILNSWLRRVDLGQVEEAWTKGGDGNDVQGWIINLPEFNTKRKYSSILEIHGGRRPNTETFLSMSFTICLPKAT